MARGALMERLGLSSAADASQLANLSAATGMSPAGDGRRGAGASRARFALAGLRPGRRLGHARRDLPARPPAILAALPRRASAASEAAGRPRGRGRPGHAGCLAEIAAELAADGAELAAMLAEQVLLSWRASVALWLLEADGALALLGESGLGRREASRWQRIPPQMDCPAQRVVRDGADLWWPDGQPEHDGAPVTGRPGRRSRCPGAARAERRAARGA